jgi:tripartite-type tricarboxylate transporter receptor subunit TctC
MGNISKYVLGATALGMAVTGLSVPSNVSAADYYAGKTITVLIGRSPGSGTDATVRSFTKFWAKYIPGNPKILNKNTKGFAAFNTVYEKGKPDGTMIAFTPYDPVSPMTGRKGFRADYSKMSFVGGFVNPPMLYVLTKRLKNKDNIMNMKGAVYGGQRPTLRFDLMGRITMDIMGNEYKYTTGFGGGKKVLNAMRRGEVDLQTLGLNLYRLTAERALVKTGKAIPLWHYDFPQAPTMAKKVFGTEIPSFRAQYTKVHGKAPSGELWELYKWMAKTVNGLSYSAWMPPGVNKEAYQALLTSFGKAAADPAYLAEQKKMFGFNLPVVDRATGLDVVKAMTDAGEKRVAFMKNYIKEGAKHNIKKKKKK